ncbi:MAG: DNA polymerase III subunit delta [Slackia sp.]|nr:DNA polymerase III subunit delta [Slackia sp.]
MAEKDALLPAYLINGEDDLKRETVLKRLRARIAKLGDIDFNCDTFDGETALGGDIVSACNTMPFASEVRLVVVTSADALRKADSEALVDYLGHPSETTVLCLTARKLAKNARLYKAVAAVGSRAVIDCAPAKKYELVRNVRAMAVTHGITLGEAASQRLVDLVGENTVRIDAELKKLALAHGSSSQPVGVAEVESMVAEAKPWDFTDAFAARDIAACVNLLGKMDSMSPYALIGKCTACIRELIAVHALAARGQSGTKPLAAYLKVPEWRVKNHASRARRWKASELRAALSSARDCERAMKTGADPDAAFLEWMLAVLRP